jgi:hypothetical protein
MRKKLFRFGIIALVVFVIVLSAILLQRQIFGPPWQGMGQMLRDFEENKEEIFVVRDFFAQLEYDFAFYPATSGERGVIFAGAGVGYIPIENRNAIEAMDLLLGQSYRHITKRDGFISFMRWGTTNAGVGIVYSMHGLPPDSTAIQFLMKLEPLPDDGWFYFEVNYNEYRRRHQNDN